MSKHCSSEVTNIGPPLIGISNGGLARTAFQIGGGSTRIGFEISRPQLIGTNSDLPVMRGGGVINIGPLLIGINYGINLHGFQTFGLPQTWFDSRRTASAWTRLKSTESGVYGQLRPNHATGFITGSSPFSWEPFPDVLPLSAWQRASLSTIFVHLGSVA